MGTPNTTEPTTAERVRKVVDDHLGGTVPADTDASLEHFGADSLDAIEIVMRLEEEFGIEIADNVGVTINTTLSELVAIVKLLLPAFTKDVAHV